MISKQDISRPVFCLGFEGCQVLDVAGPLEVLSKANEHSPPDRPPPYRITTLAERPGRLATNGAVSLHADRAFGDVEDGELDGLHTLIVAGGSGTRRVIGDPAMIGFVRRAAARAQRVVSVCSGAFILAEAGLLDGRRATTHWWVAEELAQRYPGTKVEPDAIYLRDGKVWTSAGVTAGIDLALALVEADLGRELALAAARTLVVYMMRPGGQAQFSASLQLQPPRDERLGRMIRWIDGHVAEALTVSAMAERCAMSERTFARRFASETGMTPARFVEQSRIDRARQLLERSDLGLERIADDCGLRSAEVLRRLFQRHLGLSPSQYRERFRTALRTPSGSTQP